MGGNRGKTRRFGLALIAAAVFGWGLAPMGPAVAEPAAARARAIPFTQAEVTSTDGRVFTVTWTAPARAGEVRVFARATPAASGAEGRLVGQGGADGHVTVSGLPAADRWYFELRPAHGASLVTADRGLHLPTAPNFRDVGGYRTADGRWVRMGLAYRSDQLDRLSDADLAKLARLAPALVVDLRTDAERARGLDRTPPGAEHMIADVAADAPPSGLSKISSPDEAAAFLVRANRQFVSLPSAKDAYSRLFARLQAPSGAAVYHCSAGKDRTGWATAVLLTALGVPRQTVMADYLASNGYLVEKNRAMFSAMPPATAANLEPVFTVRAAYLNAAFEEVDRRYGSFDRYLKDGLGLDDAALARLRARFLMGAPE
ncbi:MAG TPA: tyrosine-protein phosphatase [Caulobacteraceae bacterium]|nr:tyrosine-protein phosphatase [Caulobacteraceae bacterium]